MTTKQALMVIFRSPNGRDNWRPIGEADVPAWVKAPDVMARLVAGDMCMDPTEGVAGSDWFRGELTPQSGPDALALRAAAERRARRNEKGVMH